MNLITPSKLSLLFLAILAAAIPARGATRLERVPENGVQPQVAVAGDGSIHLVYLKGDPQGCDIRYVNKASSSSAWSTPVTVNSEARSAVAMGTIRGAQIAVGKDNAVHVVWNGSPPKAVGAEHAASSLFYSRMTAKKTFEPQRDLLSGTLNLDGGASVAANAAGGVLVAWHGAQPGKEAGETNRVVFTLTSRDNGATFAPLKIANDDFNGVCACCSLKVFVSPAGELLTLYRAARSMTQRDITQLTSRDGGLTFTHQTLHPWATGACPMSSAAMVASGKDTRGAWETEGKIYSSLLGAKFAPLNISGDKARHPSLAVNARGETLIAWSVGTGWQRGGELAWVVLDTAGQPTAVHGTAPGVAVWSHTAAYPEKGNDFVILH